MSRMNNFPREGQHNPVTADIVKRLEQRRDDLEVLKYSFGRDAETSVQMADQAAQYYSYTKGSQILARASRSLRTEAARTMPVLLDVQELRRESQEHLRKRSQQQSQEQTP